MTAASKEGNGVRSSSDESATKLDLTPSTHDPIHTSTIGALSLVNRDCKAFGIYIGVPARQKGERKHDLLMLEKKFMALCTHTNL